jgi:hypothetical protein
MAAEKRPFKVCGKLTSMAGKRGAPVEALRALAIRISSYLANRWPCLPVVCTQNDNAARCRSDLDGWRMRSITLPILLLGLLVVPLRAHSEQVISTTACEIIANPPAFNHKLVKFPGTVYKAMEKFSFSVASCGAEKVGNWTGIWVQYGGLEIEGVQNSMVENDRFRDFDSRVKSKGHASATFMGRYFSGKKDWSHRGSEYLWGGFGHMGMYSLLVIQEVE